MVEYWVANIESLRSTGVRDYNVNIRDTTFNRTIQLLAFGNDIDVTDRTKQDVTNALESPEESARRMALTMNQEKTKLLAITQRNWDLSYLKINNFTFECIKKFKYLGTAINNTSGIKLVVNNSLLMANKWLRSQLGPNLLTSKQNSQLVQNLNYTNCFVWQPELTIK
ncbi:hypothetical protein TNCV_601121 [Trichonephila clavipes]|nr:hypothetical protein TNCV_601121 [Trichonephila clavipes]